jgi:cytochrome P450
MEGRSMNFGAGKRMCLGKHINLLEIRKLIPLLLIRFKVTISPLKVISPLATR